MKPLPTNLVILILLMSTAPGLADVFFKDSFDRANSNDIDASATSMAGLFSPMTYAEAFQGSGEASVQIASNQLYIAVGMGMSSLFLDHNFTDAAILDADGFSVSLDIVSIVPTNNDTANRWGGFGVGLTRSEALQAGDISDPGTNGTTLRGGGANTGVCDFYADIAEDQNLRLWSNGVLLNTIPLGVASGTLKVDFFVSDFNAGSPVTAVVYVNGVQKDLRSFTWDHANANYIGISGRSATAVHLDNLEIASVTHLPANIFATATDGSTTVTEGGASDEIILSVTSSPLGYPVTIDIADALDPDQVTLSPARVVFTSADWQTPRTVTVTAIDDDDMERATHETTLSLSLTTDPASPYHGLALADMPVQVEENDCGAWGFNPADFNLDCQVNLEDFAFFVQEWIACSLPDPQCQDFRPY